MKTLNYIHDILIILKQIVRQFLERIRYDKTAMMKLLLSCYTQQLTQNLQFSSSKRKTVATKDYCGRSGFVSIMALAINIGGA